MDCKVRAKTSQISNAAFSDRNALYGKRFSFRLIFVICMSLSRFTKCLTLLAGTLDM